MNPPVIWLNGTLLPAAEVRLDPADRGLLLGDGLFETLLLRGGDVVRLDAHLARLAQGAAVLGLPLPPDRDTLAAALRATATANGLDGGRPNGGSLRLTLTAGPAPRGLPRPASPAPTLMITASPPAPPPPPARVLIATVTRRNEQSPLSRVKSLNYLDQILARNQAQAAGLDDALLRNGRGDVVCASAANLFVVLADGRLVTPPLADGALPGTRRAAALAALGATELSLRPADLPTAREVFLTSSLSVRAVVAVDGHAIGDGAPGPCRLRADAV